MRITAWGGLELDPKEVIHSTEFKIMLDEISRVFDSDRQKDNSIPIVKKRVSQFSVVGAIIPLW